MSEWQDFVNATWQYNTRLIWIIILAKFKLEI